MDTKNLHQRPSTTMALSPLTVPTPLPCYQLCSSFTPCEISLEYTLLFFRWHRNSEVSEKQSLMFYRIPCPSIPIRPQQNCHCTWPSSYYSKPLCIQCWDGSPSSWGVEGFIRWVLCVPTVWQLDSSIVELSLPQISTEEYHVTEHFPNIAICAQEYSH